METETRELAGHAYTEPIFVMRSTQQIFGFLTAWPWLRASSDGNISLQLPHLPIPLQRATEKRLNFWRKVCGCLIGALLVLATVAWRTLVLIHTTDWGWANLLLNLGYVFLSGIVGKVVAVLVARAIFILEISFLWLRVRQAAHNIRGVVYE